MSTTTLLIPSVLFIKVMGLIRFYFNTEAYTNNTNRLLDTTPTDTKKNGGDDKDEDIK